MRNNGQTSIAPKELPPELVEDAAATDKQPANPDAGKKMFDVLRSAIS
jgi:hypothetical protein